MKGERAPNRDPSDLKQRHGGALLGKGWERTRPGFKGSWAEGKNAFDSGRQVIEITSSRLDCGAILLSIVCYI